jgi:UDP-N-acetylglucosamine 2-epimerase (non-hydrolysing)
VKILSVVGARPQFIKEAVIQNEIGKFHDIKEVVVHTGQHYDDSMSGVFFDVLHMRKPEYNLGIRASSHGEMTGKMIVELEKVMLKESPDVVLLYGDTNSTLAGAIAASKLRIKIAHVEAGIRQQPKDMPEEINRVVTDHVSQYLFCPSELAVKNLERENIKDGVYFVGDIMYDLYLKMKAHFNYEIVERLGLRENEYILCTIHRDFNTDNPEKLKGILDGLSRIAREIDVVFPMHPRTRKMISQFGFEPLLDGVSVIEPVDYLGIMGLLGRCFMVITDSGGLQKEAYFSGKRVLVVMPDTGWRELIDIGWNKLVDAGDLYIAYKGIASEGNELFKTDYIYGRGNAAGQIIEILKM